VTSASFVCRKHHTEESARNRSTERQHNRGRHGTTSHHSSTESNERSGRETKHGKHQHIKHADADKRQLEKSTSNLNSNAVDSKSTKDRSDDGRKAESKYHHSKQTDETISGDRRKHRQEMDSGKKRKHPVDSVEVGTSSRASELKGSVLCANSDSADGSQKQAKTDSDQTAVQSKTAIQTVGTAFESALARYLARKGKSSTPVVCEDSE